MQENHMWSCVLQRTIPPDLACPWPVLQDDVKIQRNKNSITDKPEGQESKWGSWVTCSKYWRLLRPEEGKSFFTIFSPFLWPCLLVSSLPLLSDSRETLQLFQDFRVRWRVFFSSLFLSNRSSERKPDNTKLTPRRQPHSLKPQPLSSHATPGGTENQLSGRPSLPPPALLHASAVPHSPPPPPLALGNSSIIFFEGEWWACC